MDRYEGEGLVEGENGFRYWEAYERNMQTYYFFDISNELGVFNNFMDWTYLSYVLFIQLP